MIKADILPLIIITILTTPLFMAQPSESDSVFGIPSGIMACSDPTTGDTHPITTDTLPIIMVEATIHIMDAAAILLTALPTDPISEKTS